MPARFALALLFLAACSPDTYEVVRTQYQAPKLDDKGLADDQLDDKRPSFDPARVDSRPIEAWWVNASAAVIALDVPVVRADSDAFLLELHGSHAAAAAAFEQTRRTGTWLPSVNAIDALAKQFDDGLYAALELAYYAGLEGRLLSHVEAVRALHDALEPSSPARPFLAAALELAGAIPSASDAARATWLREFETDLHRSRVIGFYTWRPELARCFRALRMLQTPLGGQSGLPVIRELARALAQNPPLARRFAELTRFFEQLSGPRHTVSIHDLVGVELPDLAALRDQAAARGHTTATAALLPPSRNREVVLFEKLFPTNLPPDADLMREMIQAIRSGKVSLEPPPEACWLDHQVHALETLLLPERGAESERLMLSRRYKLRMLQAFQALITQRKETHVRQSAMAVGSAAAPLQPGQVRPRLRVEPAPSYFLRTARSYAFLAGVLEAAIGADGLAQLTGLTATGQRSAPLGAELAHMRQLFHGLHLVSCEDLGMAPGHTAGEVDAPACRAAAERWLAEAHRDPDLAADNRVAVPVYFDPGRRATRLWVTLGVRLTWLDARYARPPHVKPREGAGEWTPAEPHLLGPSRYLISIDEFAEVETQAGPLPREQLRALCDRERTRDRILAALSAAR